MCLFFCPIAYASFPKFDLLCTDYAQLCPIIPTSFPKTRTKNTENCQNMSASTQKRPKLPEKTQNLYKLPKLPGDMPEFSNSLLCRS